MNRKHDIAALCGALCLALGAVGGADANAAASTAPQAKVQASGPATHGLQRDCAVDHARGDDHAMCASHDAAKARDKARLAAAKAGTGASAVAAEKSEHMPVPKTGM